MSVRVLVASEVRFYREALLGALANQPGISGCRAVGLDEVVHAGLTFRPEVLLLHAATAAGSAIVASMRRADPSLRVVALSVTESEADVVSWAQAGVSGYVPSDASLRRLTETVRIVAAGGGACSPTVAGVLLRRIADLAGTGDEAQAGAQLTRREEQIVELIASGLTNKEIARSLTITVSTVKNHVHHILAKLQVSSRTEVRRAASTAARSRA